METTDEKKVNSGKPSLEETLSQALPISQAPAYFIFRDGRVWSTKTSRFLKVANTAGNNGGQQYKFVVLRHGGSSKSYYIHRLVAETYIRSPKLGEQVDHKDGNASNNNVDNLRWVTPKENTRYAIERGSFLTGDSCPWAKNSAVVVRRICEALSKGKTVRGIADELEVSKSLVNKVKYRVNWRSISNSYVW